MKKELLLSVAGMAVAGAAAEALASSCTSSPDCISLGYKYTLSDCPNGGVKCPFDTSMYFCFSPESGCTYSYTADYCSSQCKYPGTTSCQKNGTTYYASCGSSKCSYGQNCNNGTCVTPAPSCTYQYTTQSCASECKYTGYNSCVRNGTTYYQSCGTSYCLGNEVCEYGICKTPIVNCTYQYTEDNCRKQCKSIDSNSKYCLRNGIIYYETCGASKCSSGQTCENGTCNFQCIYQYTASDCANLCKNIGSKSCIRNGTTYYESCGSSKCSSGQTCENGTCHSPAPSCTYQYTAQDCASECKNTGYNSCVRNGTTYYQSCGTSKCSSGQTCENGTCHSPAPTSGYCCGGSHCGYSGTSHSNDSECQSKYGMSCYNYCMQKIGITCNDMRASCRSSGGNATIKNCDLLSFGSYYLYTTLICQLNPPTSGNCCGYNGCGYNGTSHYNDSECQSKYGMSCYDKCMEEFGITCSAMEANCRASVGYYPSFNRCGYPGSNIDYIDSITANFACQ